VTTIYIAGLYEYSGGAAKSYYEGPGGVVAMRSGGVVYYLLQDHLNSTAHIVNSAGTIQTTIYYFPFGGLRGGSHSSLTTKRFTGQYHESSIPGGEGLYYYSARWCDGRLGRFVSADPLVPEPRNPQDWNRYSYVRNNPLKYIDPSGHTARSALDLVRYLRNEIVKVAQEFDLDPLLLAGVVFSENRNDYNWLRDQD
jgi:RHS repeat-associated protein